MPTRPTSYRATGSSGRTPEARPNAHQRGYTRAWQRARAAYLRDHPLCAECQPIGRLVEATVVDHITPHRGDPVLMWDEGNFRALCKPCHDRATATHDGGFGRPVTPKSGGG